MLKAQCGKPAPDEPHSQRFSTRLLFKMALRPPSLAVLPQSMLVRSTTISACLISSMHRLSLQSYRLRPSTHSATTCLLGAAVPLAPGPITTPRCSLLNNPFSGLCRGILSVTAMKAGPKQASISSFFSKQPAGTSGTPAAQPRGKSELTDQTNQQPSPAAPEAGQDGQKRKRLRRAVEDSPEKNPGTQEAQQAAGLEDDVQPAAPPSPKRARSRSPRKTKAAASLTAAPTEAAPATTAADPQQAGGAPASTSRAAAAAAAPTSPAASPAKPVRAKAKKSPAKPAAAAVDAGDEDAISCSSSESSGSGVEEGDAQSGVKRLKRFDDTSAKKKGKGATKKVDGVGSGALQEAQRAQKADISSLCTWKAGEPVPYAFLADTLEAISETSKRLEMTATLSNCFRAILSTTPADLLPAVYMCVNRVAPAHKGIELGVGEGILLKALAASTGRSEAALKKDYAAEGDLGTLAVKGKSTQRTMFASKPLSIRGVFQTFKDIAGLSGSSSQDKKRDLIVKMLASSKGNEAGYVMRSLQGKLRIGLAEQSVLVALSHSALLHKEGTGKDTTALANLMEQAVQAVKKAYSECPSYDELVPALISHPVWEVHQHCHFIPSVPVKPMLAKPTVGVSEVLEKFTGKEFTCEYKYDGERAQIHVMDGGKKVMIFSRNSEDMTGKYPDIAARIPGLLKPGVESLVLDGEAVGWDPAAKRILPFQILSTRARKDVAIKDIKVQVVVYAFDCLYMNGKSLLQQPLTERRQAMRDAVQEKEGELQYAITRTSTDVEELEMFLSEAVDAATEGLIVKTLDDTYEPSKRSSHWLKLKKDYMDSMGDTFDVVPIGAFYGKGKRTGVFGAYLLAVYDADNEVYQTISKLGTGFSEEQLKELADSLRPSIIPAPRKYYMYGDSQLPDVWFDPVKVWEVKAADLSISPVYKAAAGLVDTSKGLSIRFPRLVRIRDDKGPEDSTSPAQVAEMYQKQAVVKANSKAADDDDE